MVRLASLIFLVDFLGIIYTILALSEVIFLVYPTLYISSTTFVNESAEILQQKLGRDIKILRSILLWSRTFFASL